MRTDQEIIARFLKWCIAQDFNQAQVGAAVGRSQGWASQIYRGEIQRLSMRTRNRILTLLEKH